MSVGTRQRRRRVTAPEAGRVGRDRSGGYVRPCRSWPEPYGRVCGPTVARKWRSQITLGSSGPSQLLGGKAPCPHATAHQHEIVPKPFKRAEIMAAEALRGRESLQLRGLIATG